MANKVILMGNLGQDPELRYTPSGTAVCNMTMATTKRYKDKSGEKKEETQWHNLVAWSAQAEIMGTHLTKGSKVYVEGELGYDKYEKDGVTITKAVITVREFEFAGSKEGGGQAAPGHPQQNSGSSSGGGAAQGRWRAPVEEPPFNPDDDIPFSYGSAV